MKILNISPGSKYEAVEYPSTMVTIRSNNINKDYSYSISAKPLCKLNISTNFGISVIRLGFLIKWHIIFNTITPLIALVFVNQSQFIKFYR